MIHSKATRISALLIGAGALLATTPALAQTRTPETSASRRAAQQAREAQRNQPAQPAPAPTGVQVNAREARALAPLQAAANAAQAQGQGAHWSAVAALVPAAERGVQTNEGRYYIAKYKYSIAVGMNDQAGQEAALAALSTNSVTPAEELAQVRRVLSRFPHLRAEAAFNARDFVTAERIYREILRTDPGDAIAQRNLSATLSNSGNSAGSLELIEQQIRTAEAGGGKASETLYRQAWDTARRGTNAAVTSAALTRLLTAYPSPTSWRAALEGVRGRTGNDVQFLVDVYRLVRLTNTIQAAEYEPLANTFGGAALLAETKSVLQAGIAAGAIQSTQVINPFNAPNGSRPAQQILRDIDGRIQQEQGGFAAETRQARTAPNGRQASNIADALSGYGRFAEAAELYRLALTKGGVDANLVNIRLGASLAQAGQRAAAEAAFRAVTGPRSELAALWLTWLASRPA